MKRLILLSILVLAWSPSWGATWGQRITNDSCDLWANSSTTTTQWLAEANGARWGNEAYSAWSGNRFIACPIAKGDSIDSAFIYMYARSTIITDSARVAIHCEDVDNSPVWLGTYADLSGRSRTSSKAFWAPMAAQTSGNWYKSVDVKAPLQQVVMRTGYAANSAVSFIIYDSTSTPTNGTAFRVGANMGTDTTHADSLLVYYHTPSGGGGGGSGPRVLLKVSNYWQWPDWTVTEGINEETPDCHPW